MLKRVSDLTPADKVDLEGDRYADNGEHPEFEFEYERPFEVVRETPDCVLVNFESGFSCGFPPDHLVKVDS